MRYVEADEREIVPRRAEHLLCGFRVSVDVEFAGRRHVAGHETGASHDHDAVDLGGDLRTHIQGNGEIGERSERHQRQLTRVFRGGLDDERRASERHLRSWAGFERHAAEAIPAVDVRGVLEFCNQRPARSPMHGNVLPAQPGQHVERVPGGNLDWYVAGDGGHADDVGAPGHGQGERDGVIDAGIDVDDQRPLEQGVRRGRHRWAPSATVRSQVATGGVSVICASVTTFTKAGWPESSALRNTPPRSAGSETWNPLMPNPWAIAA